jgi:hypothetical protein
MQRLQHDDDVALSIHFDVAEEVAQQQNQVQVFRKQASSAQKHPTTTHSLQMVVPTDPQMCLVLQQQNEPQNRHPQLAILLGV